MEQYQFYCERGRLRGERGVRPCKESYSKTVWFVSVFSARNIYCLIFLIQYSDCKDGDDDYYCEHYA